MTLGHLSHVPFQGLVKVTVTEQWWLWEQEPNQVGGNVGLARMDMSW